MGSTYVSAVSVACRGCKEASLITLHIINANAEYADAQLSPAFSSN